MCDPPVSVYKSVESKSISPAGGEILNVDLRVPDIHKITSDYSDCLSNRLDTKRNFPAWIFWVALIFLKMGIKTSSSRSQDCLLAKRALKSQWSGFGLMSFPEFFSAHLPCSLHLAPEQQSILGRAGLSVVFRLYFDHLDLNENAHIFSRDAVAQIRRRGRCHTLVWQSWMIKYLKARRWNLFSQRIL